MSQAPAIKDKDRAQTPRWFFRRVEDRLGLMFCHDACAEPGTAKVPGSFWTIEDNALDIDWRDVLATRIPNYTFQTAVWMNPPYSNLDGWCAKAALEASKGLIVVGLVPDMRSSRWFQRHVHNVASSVFMPDGRINFLNPDGSAMASTNQWPSAVVLWTPWGKDQKSTAYSYFDRNQPKKKRGKP